jgi:hypothetical protein
MMKVSALTDEVYERVDVSTDFTFVDFKHQELCRACDEPIDYEHVYHSEIFTTPDDRVFHIDCWTAWVLDGNEL